MEKGRREARVDVMLMQFSVENFLSFRDAATFSMVADSGDQRHPGHLLSTVADRGVSLLRAAALYGANGSGKSNLVKALMFARDRVLRGSRPGQTIPVTPFRLGRADQKGRLSALEFLIQHEGVRYSYGFRLDSTRIAEEWLFATPKKQEVRYFERTTSEAGETRVEFGPQFTGRGAKQRQFLEFVAQGTRPNQLFLTEAAERNVEAVNPLRAWFEDVLLILPAESPYNAGEFVAHSNVAFTGFLSDFLRDAGTGIEGITTEEADFDIDIQFSDAPEELREQVRELVAELDDENLVTVTSTSGRRFLLKRNENGRLVQILVRTQHRAEDGRLIPFLIEAESEGTQRLIHLLPALFGMTENSGKVLVLDELDRRLHALLCRRFVEAALRCGGPDSRNQLIFTTHDTNLLDLDLLRRDEIWFVEKDAQGASKLYSLSEFKIRPDLKLEKGYLNGRFGAVPFFGDICRLGWTGKNAAEKRSPVAPA